VVQHPHTVDLKGYELLILVEVYKVRISLQLVIREVVVYGQSLKAASHALEHLRDGGSGTGL
jgi:hypothetical protein